MDVDRSIFISAELIKCLLPLKDFIKSSEYFVIIFV